MTVVKDEKVLRTPQYLLIVVLWEDNKVEFLTSLGGWSWVILGLVLTILEAVVPGVFLIWFGGAAILTGLLSVFFGLALTAQFLMFGVLAAGSVVFGWKFGIYAIGESDRPYLNVRGKRYIGKSFQLDEAIINGNGRVRVGDTTWRVEGPDLAAETTVRVTGVKGTTLLVEAAE